jgi:TFIIIC subunit triple barrel domain
MLSKTFLVDLDLSSLNNVIKSRTPGFRRNLQKPLVRNEGAGRKQRSGEQDDHTQLEGRKNEEIETLPSSTPERNTPVTQRSVVGSDIQILGFHTHNPMISYQDQIYSCTWSDMVGTNLFFSTHERRPIFEPQASTDKYDLLGTSRIKLIGHKVKVTQKPGTKKRGRPTNDTGREWEASINEDQILAPGKSLGNLRYNNAKVNADIKRQARFLEKFMDVKRAKGETDNVRTVVTRQSVIANNKARMENQNGQMGRAALHDEVERLNRRVVKGDTEALVRLQEIYSLLEEDGDDGLPESPNSVPLGTSTPTPNTAQSKPK